MFVVAVIFNSFLHVDNSSIVYNMFLQYHDTLEQIKELDIKNKVFLKYLINLFRQDIFRLYILKATSPNELFNVSLSDNDKIQVIEFTKANKESFSIDCRLPALLILARNITDGFINMIPILDNEDLVLLKESLINLNANSSGLIDYIDKELEEGEDNGK